MSNLSYKEQLLHPEWQKKRLQILNRDSFTCQFCFSKEDTLHVHHRYYEDWRQVWEYENESLITLCHKCHKEYEDSNKDNSPQILAAAKRVSYSNVDQAALIGFLKAVGDLQPELKFRTLRILLNSTMDGEFQSFINRLDEKYDNMKGIWETDPTEIFHRVYNKKMELQNG